MHTYTMSFISWSLLSNRDSVCTNLSSLCGAGWCFQPPGLPHADLLPSKYLNRGLNYSSELARGRRILRGNASSLDNNVSEVVKGGEVVYKTI